MDIKLVIFDLDGVIVDACEWHRRALNYALYEVSNTKIEDNEHTEVFNGIPTRKKLSILVSQGRVEPRDIEKIYNIKQEKTMSMIESQAVERPEKIDLINSLKSSGIIVACFTNSIKKTANLMLKKTGVYDLFDLILTNQDVKNPKPNPEGYNYVMDYFNCGHSETVIIEDSPKGVEAATASKAKVIIVKNPDEVDSRLLEDIL